MKLKAILNISLFIALFSGCTQEWEDHYNIYPETVDQNVWEAIQNDPEISDFVQVIKDMKYDTLFKSDIPYTLFAPDNDAFSQYKNDNVVNSKLLNYHISKHFIQSGSANGKRRIQTLAEKFALFEKYENESKLDGIPLISESPLYKNGKYFILDEVAEPRPNLYQYFEINNTVLKEYIDRQDSVILDKERSTPIGYDEYGNTIYDSVTVVFNEFEADFFPVSKEFRNNSATIVFPLKEDYNDALTVMAQDLGAGYTDYRDIPAEWQNETLVPYLLEQGVFLNMIEPEEFMWKSEEDTAKLLNILGDSISVFYTPVDKFVCSNGYAYNYQDFTIPDSLYKGTSIYEGEWLLNQTGINKYSWTENVTVISDQVFNPVQEFVSIASNDSTLKVPFPSGYSGKFSVEFKTKPLFPAKYLMVVRTHIDVGGVYDIYVNDELIKTFDYYDYVKYRGLMLSETGEIYEPVGSYNKFDMFVDNIDTYSRPKVRFEYKEPGRVRSNGLIIDYVEFIPVP